MANSNSPQSKRARAVASANWRKDQIAKGRAKNKAFYLVDDQVDIVEQALNSINPKSHVQALVELCRKHNERK